ncbi:MAG: DUF1844 domain-containing protein [Nitrospinota bacterium]
MESNQEEKSGSSFSFKDKRHSSLADDEENSKSENISSNRDEAVTQPESESEADSTNPNQGDGIGASEVDFPTFILSLSSNALYHLGSNQDPVSGKTSLNLDLAKQTIDIIALLKEKTVGNITKQEGDLIEHTLYDLRMKFVEALKGSSRSE